MEYNAPGVQSNGKKVRYVSVVADGIQCRVKGFGVGYLLYSQKTSSKRKARAGREGKKLMLLEGGLWLPTQNTRQNRGVPIADPLVLRDDEGLLRPLRGNNRGGCLPKPSGTE
jgi:hypothetical protein